MKSLFLLIFATITTIVFGQTVCPTVPDFMDLTSPCVTCNYGYTYNPFLNTGIANTRHTRITAQGFDPNTGNLLPLIPEGDSVSIRLGNEQIGAEAEAITYNFKVEADKALLSVKFAVVLEDPGHSPREQPRFVVRILNENGELVDPCAAYDITASAGIPGFETHYGYGTPVRWRPWTTVALDMSAYIGQAVKVQFVTYDCSQYGHSGYAYFTAECLPSKLELTQCSNINDTIELSAPPFCESYAWTNGDTTASSKFVKNDNNPIAASCLITSVTGCQFTLNAYVSNISSFSKDTTIFDTICEGDTYTQNEFDLPPQYNIGTSTHINTFYDFSSCTGMVTVVLNITVKQRYWYFEDAICYGEDYDRYGFHLTKPEVGVLRDTSIIQRENTCDSVAFLTLTVSPSNQSFSKNILGNSTPCTGELEAYTLPDADLFTSFNWIAPENVNLIGTPTASKIFLQFTDEALADTLKLYAATGCGNVLLTLPVEPHLSHYLPFTDTICSGLPYAENDFNIPRQDSVGFKIFSQKFSTQNGCDSVRTLHLYVFPTPEVNIQTSKDVICEDDSVELHAVSTIADFKIARIKIGDILCTDGSILDTGTFKTSGKTADGVVYWISLDETHAWVASLEHDTLMWGSESVKIPGVTTLVSHPLFDTAGYQNTLHIRNAGDAEKYPAAWSCDFDNGWFLPAITQTKMLFGMIPFINESLAIAGGTPINMHLHLGQSPFSIATMLQSSTQSTDERMWAVLPSGAFSGSVMKRDAAQVRCIRYFQINH